MLNISKNLKLSIILLLIGFVIHFSGFVSPYWNVLPDVDQLGTTNSIIRLGLWTICHRKGKTDKCVQFNDPPKQMMAARLIETLSVIFYLLSLLTFWLYRRHPVYGSAILVACMVFIILIVETTAIGCLLWVTFEKIQLKHKLSWAFGLTVVSVAFPVVAGWFVSEERKSFKQQCRRNSLEHAEKRESLLH